MHASLDQSVAALHRRVFWGVFAGNAGRLGMIALLGGGVLVLLVRFLLDVARAQAIWALAPVVLVPLAALLVARSRQLSRAGAVAWLDARAGGSGALVTQLEVGDGAWSSHVDAALSHLLVLPRARLGRTALQILPPLGFAIAALLVEMPRDPALPPKHLQEAAIERVEEKLATLEEQVALEPELASELEKKIERLEDDAGEPEQAFEALDRLEERLSQESEMLAQKGLDAEEALKAATGASSSDPERAQKELEKTLGDLSKAGFSKNLPEDLQRELGASSLELPAGTKLEPLRIEALSKDVAKMIAAKLDKLGAAGLVKLGRLAKAGELARLDDFQFSDHVCDESCKKKPGGT